MKKLLLLVVFTALALPCNSFGSDSGTFTDDRDGREYKWVKIGEQIWMAENLNYNAEGSKCYGNQPENCEKYGKLYNWETAKTACPSGWHLPSNEEWQTLENFAGGEDVAGKRLKATSGWYNESENYLQGTDEFGFTALPGGSCQDGSWNNVGFYGFWWSSNEYYRLNAYSQYMFFSRDNMYTDSHAKTLLFSVRCLKD